MSMKISIICNTKIKMFKTTGGMLISHEGRNQYQEEVD